MSEDLAERRCKPCEGGVAPLNREQSEQLMRGLHAGWSLDEDGVTITRRFEFSGYDKTLGFTNAAAWVAICEDHHPVLTVAYGSCTISYTTHSISGLSDNDFICAAKIDRLAGVAAS
jgi:4a-hydroxytetrahydrobiopterin dehydratase